MPKQTGKRFRVWLVAEDGTNKALAFEKTNSFDIGNALVTDGDKDSDNYDSSLDGKRSWGESLTLNYDPEDEQVQGLIADMVAPDGDTKRLYLIGDAEINGDIAWKGHARTESISIPAPDGELMTIDISIKGVSKLEKVTHTTA